MNEITLIKKSDDETNTLSTKKVIAIFTKSDDLEEIRQAVRRAEDRLYVSWASVDVSDKQHEKIPIADVIAEQDILLERNGPISDSHTNRIVGQTLAYKVMQHPRTLTLGVLHLNKIFPHSELDQQVWTETQEGKRTGSSVGGFASGNPHMELDPQTNQPISVIEGFNQYETANVYNPANPFALNEAVSVVAKSMPVISKSLDNIKTFTYKELISEHEKLVTALVVRTDALLDEQLNDQSKELQQYKIEAGVDEQDNVINKVTQENTMEVIKMDDIQKQEFDSLKKEQVDLKKNVDDLIKAVAELKKCYDEDKDKEKKKSDDKDEDDKKEKPEVEDKKKAEKVPDKKTDDNEDKEVFKEGVTADPDKSKDNNQKDVFKELDAVKKELADIKKGLTSVETPRAPINDIAKGSDLALDIAMGRTKKSWQEVNKMFNE